MHDQAGFRYPWLSGALTLLCLSISTVCGQSAPSVQKPEGCFYLDHGAICSVVFHPSQPLLLASGRKEGTLSLGVIRVYSVDSGEEYDSFPDRGEVSSEVDRRAGKRRVSYVLPSRTYKALAVCGSGTQIAAVGPHGDHVDLFELDSEKKLRPDLHIERPLLDRLHGIMRIQRPVEAVVTDARGSGVFTASSAEVRHWKLASERTSVYAQPLLAPLALSRHGRWLAGYQPEKGVVLWDNKEQKEAKRFPVERPVEAIALNDNATRIAFACPLSDKVPSNTASPLKSLILVYEVDSGRFLGRLEGHTDHVLSLGFAEDSRRLVSGSFDRTVRLWDIETAKSTEITGFDWETRATVSSEGTWIAVIVACHRLECWTVSAEGPPRRLWHDEWVAHGEHAESEHDSGSLATESAER